MLIWHIFGIANSFDTSADWLTTWYCERCFQSSREDAVMNQSDSLTVHQPAGTARGAAESD
jgi:hypothetical protein